jgi:hypothetical protein
LPCSRKSFTAFWTYINPLVTVISSVPQMLMSRRIWAEQLKGMFEMGKKRAGIVGRFPGLSTAGFRRGQMELWGR